jgi:P-type Mg2+ transporter
LLTQLLIVLVLRVRTSPWRGAPPARPVVIASVTAAVIGLLIPATMFGGRLGLVPLPVRFLPWIALTALGYGLTAELLKRWYLRRHDDWL